VKHYFVGRAASVLGLGKPEGKEFEHLSRNMNNELLAELGRLDDEIMRGAAAEICRLEMKSKDAVLALRAWRGKSTPPNEIFLAVKIAKAIDDYAARHPGMSSDQIGSALSRVQREYARTDDGLDGEDEPSAPELEVGGDQDAPVE
jgi:hypothetical protein